jgi:hypothetical protein
VLASATAQAQEQVLMFDGEVPSGEPDHFFVPFDVPAGTVEIELRHDDLSEANILDFGLDDPAGHRGWGGGEEEPAIVAAEAASRGYLPGPITAGMWRVVVGKAKVNETPALYHLEVVLRDVATLAPEPERMPYAHVPALEAGPRWYAGDFHVHSLDSTDAHPTLEEIITFAKRRGLDFVVITDHNNLAAQSRFAAVQANHPDFLLVPGMEFTTYDGHATAIGATTWVDHKIGQPGVTIEGAAQAFADQGALFSINHPTLDLGDLCIGCAWKHDLSPELINGVEITTGGWTQSGFIFAEGAMELWNTLCATGQHVAAIGGSDDHRAGVDIQMFGSPIGDPTTMVYADELSVPAIVEAIRLGRTMVKMQGPADPQIELTPNIPPDGDTVRAESFALNVRVTGANGDLLRIFADGALHGEVSISADPFETEVGVEPPLAGESRWRAEVWTTDDVPRAVTSHVWTAYQAGVVGEKPKTSGASPFVVSGDCDCRFSRAHGSTPAWLALLCLGWLTARRRGR